VKFVRFFGDNKLSLQKLLNSESIIIDKTTISTNRLILVYQIHSANIKIVTENDCGAGVITQPIHGFDGLITNQKDVFLCIKTADCIPIFLWDKQKEIVASLHSGRTGTEQDIAGKAVEIMMDNFSCDPKDICVEIGPAICGKCYPVNQTTFNEFVQKTGVDQTFPNLDLKKVVISNMLEIGILHENIFNHNICTKEDVSYFSYRENQTTERQISIIGMV
jgi:purine-nucleoside/S-methyl-5'-thioadenosine phosphorylase / adenosine deaminase